MIMNLAWASTSLLWGVHEMSVAVQPINPVTATVLRPLILKERFGSIGLDG
jgi:hypothetical protein